MGGPKGCKAQLGTDKIAAATLTNMLMIGIRSWDDDGDAGKTVCFWRCGNGVLSRSDRGKKALTDTRSSADNRIRRFFISM